MNRLLNLTVSSEFILNMMKRAMSNESHASPLVIHKSMEGSGFRLNAYNINIMNREKVALQPK